MGNFETSVIHKCPTQPVLYLCYWGHGLARPGTLLTENVLAGAVPEDEQQDNYLSVSAEEQQVVDADRVAHAASYMEMTVPLLHEAMPARGLLTDMTRGRKPQVQFPPSHARLCTAQCVVSSPGGAGRL